MSAEADVLRRAADRVRSDAARASRAPWHPEHGSDEAPGIGLYDWWDVVDGGGELTVNVGAWPVAQANAEWIGLVGPQVAEPLAAWLETAARFVDASLSGGMPVHPLTLDALDLARVLLGETETSP